MKKLVRNCLFCGVFSFWVISPSSAATIDIVIAIDSSGSMLNDTGSYVDSSGNTVIKTRWTDTIDFTKWLISSFNSYEATSQNEYRFGIVQFGGLQSDPVASIEYGLTEDQSLSSVISAVDGLVHIAGYTPTRDAVQQALNLFNDQSDDLFAKHFFLITDGMPTFNQSPCSLMPTGVNTTVIAVDLPLDQTGVECLVNYSADSIVGLADFSQTHIDNLNNSLTAVVPLPAAVWLFMSGLLVLIGTVKYRE